MQKLFVLILLMLPVLCFGQNEAEKLYDKAYSYSTLNYRDKDTLNLLPPNYDSAIYYLKILRNKYPNYRSKYVDDLFQDSYFGNGDFSKSIEYSMKILTRYKEGFENSNDISSESYYACENIAKSYLAIGEYKKAILYYDSLLTKYKPSILGCGLGVEIMNAYRNKDLFFAYLGLEETSKAIEISTPHFFDSRKTQYIDSNYSKKYFEAVNKVYSESLAICNVDIANDSLIKKVTVFFNSEEGNLPLDNAVTLFGAKLDFLEEYSSFLSVISKETYQEHKDNVLERFRNSVGYIYYHSK